MKYFNYIIFIVLFIATFVFKDSIHISTNLLSLFASKESIEKLSIASELGYTKELLISVKGFDKDSKKTVDEITKALSKLDGIELVISKATPSKELQNYYKNYYALLSNFDARELNTTTVNRKLRAIREEQQKSIFYTPIDRNDPLKLFNLKAKNLNFTQKGSYITLENYGYLIDVKTDVSPSQMGKAEKLYKEIKKITTNYKNVIAFAGFFYTVENSIKIKEDVRLIAILSSIVLFIIYFVLLKNFKLLFNTVITLVSSVVFAGLISSIVFDNFHIISFAFGASISAISIDYLFHYYFHNFYRVNKRLDINVFYGYLTTTVAFIILSFISVPIIAQISFFTVLALTFSYIMFTFLYKNIELKEYQQKVVISKTVGVIPSFIFLFLSLSLLIYSFENLKLDDDLRNLDYQNKKLREIEQLFKESNKRKLIPIIVQARTEDELMKNLHILHKESSDTFSLASFVLDKHRCENRKSILNRYDFKELNNMVNIEAKNLGFKDGYFKNVYSFTRKLPSCDNVDLSIFRSLNLSFYKKDNMYYTIALVTNVKKNETLDFVSSLDIKVMFEKVVKKMYKDISLYSMFALFIITVMLIVSVKKRFLYAVNYILFPLSFTLAILVSLYTINIMHIFAFIILIAIGIDYGIYMSNTKKKDNTMLAIQYSLLSTFGAFGVLAFSSITALNSIGIVISLGMSAIFILLKVMK